MVGYKFSTYVAFTILNFSKNKIEIKDPQSSGTIKNSGHVHEKGWVGGKRRKNKLRIRLITPENEKAQRNRCFLGFQQWKDRKMKKLSQAQIKNFPSANDKHEESFTQC